MPQTFLCFKRNPDGYSWCLHSPRGVVLRVVLLIIQPRQMPLEGVIRVINLQQGEFDDTITLFCFHLVGSCRWSTCQYTLVNGHAQVTGSVKGAWGAINDDYDTPLGAGDWQVEDEVGSYFWPDWAWSKGEISPAICRAYADVRSVEMGNGVVNWPRNGDSTAKAVASHQTTKDANGTVRVWFHNGATAPGWLANPHIYWSLGSGGRADVGPDTFESDFYGNALGGMGLRMDVRKNGAIVWTQTVASENWAKTISVIGANLSAGQSFSANCRAKVRTRGQEQRASITGQVAVANN